MRPQGVWIRICALVALIALVLPASANVASCMSRAKGMTCCMAGTGSVAKLKAVTAVHDCCHPQVESSSSGSVLTESKSKCRCVLKSAPIQPTNVSVLNTATDQFEVAMPTAPVGSTDSEPASAQTQTIFFGDSSPPYEPHGSATHGRAPPVPVF